MAERIHPLTAGEKVKLRAGLLDLVKKGLVEPEEAYANAVNKQKLRSMLERVGVKLQAA